jgi:hypothetical protein
MGPLMVTLRPSCEEAAAWIRPFNPERSTGIPKATKSAAAPTTSKTAAPKKRARRRSTFLNGRGLAAAGGSVEPAGSGEGVTAPVLSNESYFMNQLRLPGRQGTMTLISRAG